MAIEGLVLTDADHQEKLAQANGLLFCHKPLCPNCKAMEKVIEKFLAANPSVALMRIDSTQSPEAMKALGADRVPAIYILKAGNILAQKIGLMNVRELMAFYQAAQQG